MSRQDFSQLSDEDLLVQIRDGDLEAWNPIYQRLRPKLLAWCHRRASTLPSDLYYDVVQETLQMLFTSKLDFDPNRGSASAFLFGLFLNALRKVNRTSTDPIERQTHYLGIETHDSGLSVADTVADHYDGSEPSADALHVKEASRQIVDYAQVSAPTVVRDAINLLHSERFDSMSAVARQLGVNRITLTRHVRAWGSHYEYLVAA